MKKVDIDDRVYNMIHMVVTPIVINVRRSLAIRYDVQEGEHSNYRDLCDIAVDEFLREIKIYCDVHRIPFEGHKVHGEIAHSPLSQSRYWGIEHSWCRITINGITLRVDPTSGQFRRYFGSIPDFIVSPEKIKYFVCDHDSIIAWAYHTENEVIVNIVFFMVFKLWGHISDIINLFHRRKMR